MFLKIEYLLNILRNSSFLVLSFDDFYLSLSLVQVPIYLHNHRCIIAIYMSSCNDINNITLRNIIILFVVLVKNNLNIIHTSLYILILIFFYFSFIFLIYCFSFFLFYSLKYLLESLFFFYIYTSNISFYTLHSHLTCDYYCRYLLAG